MSASPAEHADWLEQDGVPDEGYEAWARAKILRGLEQTRDRGKMISAEQVWRELGLER